LLKNHQNTMEYTGNTNMVSQNLKKRIKSDNTLFKNDDLEVFVY
jgi:hypothetical protein